MATAACPISVWRSATSGWDSGVSRRPPTARTPSSRSPSSTGTPLNAVTPRSSSTSGMRMRVVLGDGHVEERLAVLGDPPPPPVP